MLMLLGKGLLLIVSQGDNQRLTYFSKVDSDEPEIKKKKGGGFNDFSNW